MCKPLGLIDDLTRFFLPTNQRRSRVSTSATMNLSSSLNTHSADRKVLAVSKLTHPKPLRWQKPLLRGSKEPKHRKPAVHAALKLKQKSVTTGSRVAGGVRLRKPASNVRRVVKQPKHRRNRQHRDHVESLIDGLTDYFSTHGERRLKSPALKSIASYGSERTQAASSHQINSPTELSKQLLPSMYSSGSMPPRKQKKATVEKLFDGLSSFYSVQSEHRRRSSTVSQTPESPEAGVKTTPTLIDRGPSVAPAELKFSKLMNIPSKVVDRKMAALKTSQLKGLFDGLSHLYTAHGDRKRRSPFFFAAEPAKSQSNPTSLNQQPASEVKQEPVGTAGPSVSDTSAGNQTIKVAKEKQQRSPGKLSTNKLPVSKKSSKPVPPVVRKQPSSSGMFYHHSYLM